MRRFIMGFLASTMLFTSCLSAMVGYDEYFSPNVNKILVDLEKYGDEDKLYIDEEEMKSSPDAFYIHLGNNLWVHTNAVNKDTRGTYTYRASIARSMVTAGYEKTWRCPYCYHYWPVGTPCQNKDCPSKYKG
jgi:hypothetical protein